MKKNIFAKMSMLATLLFALLLSLPARADLIITLAEGPGTNLANIYVGDTLTFNTIGSSTDSGEYLTSYPAVHILSPSSGLEFVSGVYSSSVFDTLTTNPILVVWTLLAVNPGIQDLYNGFPEINPVTSQRIGVTTSLGTYSPADSNHLTFEIRAVPEPGSFALLAAGLGLLGFFLARRNKDAV